MGYFGIRKSCHVIPGIYEWLHTGHMHPLYGGEGEGPQGTPGGKGWRSGGHVALFSMGLELGTSNSAGGIHTPFIWFHSIFSDTSRWTQVTAVFGNSAFCEAIHLWDWCAPLQLLGCTYYFFYLCGFQELKTPKSIIVHTKAEHKKGLKFKATFIFVSRDTCFFIFFLHGFAKHHDFPNSVNHWSSLSHFQGSSWVKRPCRTSGTRLPCCPLLFSWDASWRNSQVTCSVDLWDGP